MAWPLAPISTCRQEACRCPESAGSPVLANAGRGRGEFAEVGEDDRQDEVGIEPRRLQRQVDGEAVEQCVHPLDLDRTVTIGMESPELLQCVESVAAEFPDTVVDLFSNPCDLGMRRRRSGEGGPYRGLGLSLGVER